MDKKINKLLAKYLNIYNNIQKKIAYFQINK